MYIFSLANHKPYDICKVLVIPSNPYVVKKTANSDVKATKGEYGGQEFTRGQRTHRENREQRLCERELISACLAWNIFRGRAQASIHQLNPVAVRIPNQSLEGKARAGRGRRGEWFEPSPEPCACAKANLISSPGVNLVSFVFPIGRKSRG